MPNRVRGISPRARRYVREQATAVMEATCRIERVSGGGYNEATRLHEPASRVVLYEGPCRLWEVSGQAGVVVGDDEIHMQSTNLSIPWDAELKNGWPRRADQFVMLSHHTDPAVVGKRGEILDPVKAGDLRATRRFAVQMQQGGEQE
jgi:hypothetical protein